MKKMLCVLLALAMMLSMVSMASAKEEKITIRIGHSMAEDGTYQVCAEAFAEKVTELLGADRVECIIYPNAVLGSQTEMIESMQMGTLECCVFGRHSQIDSRLDVLNLPFLFENDEHVRVAMRGEEGASIRERVAECFLNADIVMLGMWEPGFREITSSKPINSMADLKGLLIRTPNTPVLMNSFTAWGASPTPMDFGELYTALQTKTVDAQENPYQLINTSAFYEVQSNLCVTNHSTIVDQIQFSRKIFEAWPEDVQAAVREAAAYAANVAGDHNVATNNALLDKLSGLMEVTYMPEEEIAEMKRICIEEIWPQYIVDDFTRQLVEDIQNLPH